MIDDYKVSEWSDIGGSTLGVIFGFFIFLITWFLVSSSFGILGFLLGWFSAFFAGSFFGIILKFLFQGIIWILLQLFLFILEFFNSQSWQEQRVLCSQQNFQLCTPSSALRAPSPSREKEG